MDVCITTCMDVFNRIPRQSKALVTAAMPTFTNPNNVVRFNVVLLTLLNITIQGILTGEAPRMHGITGNYYYDEQTDQEVSCCSRSMLAF